MSEQFRLRPALSRLFSPFLKDKSSNASGQVNRPTTQFSRPSPHDHEAWPTYWRTQNQPWRTEPEIDSKRQKYLAQRCSISPDVKQGIYSFKGIKLGRADVEWLLSIHEDEWGPVDWNDESQHEQSGVDLRGADLRRVNLRGLPLTCMKGGLDLREWSHVTQEQVEAAAVHLEEADLTAAHLEKSSLIGAYLRKGNLREAHLEHAILRNARMEEINLSYAHLEGAVLLDAHLERGVLIGAHMKHARLAEAHLEGADLRVALLEEARLADAYLERAYLRTAHLEGAVLENAHLEGAILYQAHLEHARLNGAHLEGADLRRAHLEGAKLIDAHLEGKKVNSSDLERVKQWLRPFIWPEMHAADWQDYLDFPAVLPPADLREAIFDSTTRLNGVTLGDKEQGLVSLADVSWGSVNLAVVNLDWNIDWARPVPIILGDEREARQWKMSAGKKTQQQRANEKAQRLEKYQAAVRAYRQLSVELRNQGMNEEAAYFAHRAQVLQRKALWQRIVQQKVNLWRRILRLGDYLVSCFLDLLSGYGYKPQRSFIAYIVVITGFATAYYFLGHSVGPSLSPLGAFVFSMTSFHGRGFFPGGIALDDPLTVLAALEAFVGLIIEVTFIATLTQRFFGR